LRSDNSRRALSSGWTGDPSYTLGAANVSLTRPLRTSLVADLFPNITGAEIEIVIEERAQILIRRADP
jgi:hypothetical protein